MRPKNRRPTTPGEILSDEFLNDHGWTKEDLAHKLGVNIPTVEGLIDGRTKINPYSAAALADLFGTTPNFWLTLQLCVDDWDREFSESLLKALEAGNYNAAPSTLVQGSALQIEDLSPVMEVITYGPGRRYFGETGFSYLARSISWRTGHLRLRKSDRPLNSSLRPQFYSWTRLLMRLYADQPVGAGPRYLGETRESYRARVSAWLQRQTAPQVKYQFWVRALRRPGDWLYWKKNWLFWKTANLRDYFRPEED